MPHFSRPLLKVGEGPDAVREVLDPGKLHADGLRRRRHWEMLLVASAVLLISCTLEVRPDQRVGLRAIPSCTLPPSCMSWMLFGVKCPGCGLTRSFVQLAHGDWHASVASHRVGWMLALSLALQIPYRLYQLRSPNTSVLLLAASRLFGWFLITALIVNWLYEMLRSY